MQTLSGRTCVIAGGSAGDGIDTVKELCRAGMNVVMATHQAEKAKALVEEINGLGFAGKCEAIGETERGPAEEDAETYRYIAETYGSVDVIISNTGDTGSAKAIEDLSAEALMKEVEHLVAGAFKMARAALPFLRESKAPRIILMSSVEGIYGGRRGSFANAVAKGAVHALALNMAARLAVENITVNCIAKGAIPRAEGIRPGNTDPETFMPYIPMGRLGTPQDLAQTVCYLASEEAGYVTGQTICVSGGLEFGKV